MILFPQRFQNLRKLQTWIDLMQQLLYRLLALAVAALAKMGIAQIPVLIEKILGGPVAVGERFPDFSIAVHNNRISQAELANSPLHIRLILRERELRCVDPDHGQPVLPVAIMPGLYIG